MDDFFSLVLLMVRIHAHPYRPNYASAFFIARLFRNSQITKFEWFIWLTKRVYCFAYNIPQNPDLKALGDGIHLLLSLHIREKSVQINQKLAFVNVFNCSHHTVPFYSRFLLNVSDGKIWCRFQTVLEKGPCGPKVLERYVIESSSSIKAEKER